MAEVQYNKNGSPGELRQLIDRINDFKYFLSLDPQAYFMGWFKDFNQKKIMHAVPYDNIPNNIFQLQWVRLFGEKIQLEWKQYSSICHIVFFQQEKGIKLSDFQSLSLQKKGVRKEYLYGELDYHEYEKGNIIWYEGQIPRLLKYPVEESTINRVYQNESIRPYLEIEEYIVEGNKYDGNYFHYRNIDLKEGDN